MFKNRAYAEQFIGNALPQIQIVRAEATYLLWLDCSKISGDAEKLCSFVRAYNGLYITAGNQYRGNGSKFVRINLACPRSTLTDGLNRFADGVRAYLLKERK